MPQRRERQRRKKSAHTEGGKRNKSIIDEIKSEREREKSIELFLPHACDLSIIVLSLSLARFVSFPL
jgi:hypothetical protein